MASRSPNCTNTDISGIGVRSATYAQNLLSFVPAAVALLNDGKISNSEREFIKDQSTNILLTAFGLLLSAIIQAKTDQGLDNYHLALVLNLSWLNNTNTFIYLVLFIHRKIWNLSPGEWSWGVVIRGLFRLSLKGTTANKSTPGDIEMADISPQQKSGTINQSAQGEPEPLLDFAVGIGSFHLSLMGAVGIWLWSNPMSFGNSPSCPANATISISVLGRTLPMASQGLRAISLIFYTAVLIPVVNLVLPTALILMPRLICPLGKWSDPKKRESAAVQCVALGLVLLFTINVIFIVDTELSISRNESHQSGQDSIWTLGQTLALLLLVLPIRGLIQFLLKTTSLVLPFVGETAWGRAVRGFRKYDATVLWSEVYRWRWLIGDTPVKADSNWLLHALIDGQLDIERFLCGNGADWDAVMRLAAEQGHAEIVSTVFTRGADINSRDGMPLYFAARNGHLDIVRFLVKNGADVNSLRGGLTPLYIATYNGHLEVVCFLVKNGADVHRGELTPLFIAAFNGHLEIMCFLVKNGSDVKISGTHFVPPLAYAVGGGHLKIVRFLVENGADVSSEDGVALFRAAQNDHLEIVRFLVEKGADVNSRNGMPLRYAAENGHLEIVRFLVENGADINSQDGMALFRAAQNGHLETVRFLIENGTDVHSRGGMHLYIAARNGHVEIVRVLVKHGADVNRRDGTPLRYAAENGHLEIVRFLVENGADVNSEDGAALYFAARSGHLEIMRFLAENGAHVNSRGTRFVRMNTPVSAAWAGQIRL